MTVKTCIVKTEKRTWLRGTTTTTTSNKKKQPQATTARLSLVLVLGVVYDMALLSVVVEWEELTEQNAKQA